MEDLKEKLELHRLWLEDNTKGNKLNLRHANLSGADFKWVNFINVDLRNADLRNANLSGVNFSGAYLSGVNFSGANLNGTDLSHAYLRHADLSSANLSSANLRHADLSGVDLSGVDLRNCIGNNIEVKSLQLGTYLVSYTKDILNIGCQSHTHSDWRTFSDSIILDMDGEKALNWWSLNKHIIFELIDREQ